jgi:mono/diheme cytochrome c family protein
VAAVALGALTGGVRFATRPPAPQVLRQPDHGATSAIERGRTVYAEFGCAMCHGADAKGGFANPNSETDSKVPGLTLVAEGFTRGELRKKILDGLATVGRADPNGPRPPYRMPGWKGQMSDRQVADVVEYLWSLYPKKAADSWR